jgi:hypothetical protein
MSSVSNLALCHVEIVGGCQLQCVGCPNSSLRGQVESMPVEVFERCLRNIDVDAIEVLRLFNYGEPLLHADLPGILASLAGQRWSAKLVEISTNAQWVDWEAFEAALGLSVLNRLVVSCDGDGTAASYESLRPGAKWSRLFEFLDRVAKLRARLCLRMELVARVVISHLADRTTWDRLLLPVGWTPEYRGWKYLPESSRNMTGRIPCPGSGICKFVQPSQLFVACDGIVVPCCAHPRAGELGDLKARRLSEIRRGEAYRRFVDSLATQRTNLSVCGLCEFGPLNSPGPSAGANLPLD